MSGLELKLERSGEERYGAGTMRLFEDVAAGHVTPKDAVDRLMVIDAVREHLGKRGWFDGERLVFGGLYVLGVCFFASAVALTVGLVRWAVGL